MGDEIDAMWSNTMSDIVSSIFAPPTEEEIQAAEDTVKKNAYLADVLEQAVQKQAEMKGAAEFNIPMLPPPELSTNFAQEFAAKIGAVGQSGVVDPQLLAEKMQLTQSELLSKLLDNWNVSVKKSIKEDDDYKNSPVAQAIDETLKDGTAAFAQNNAMIAMFMLGTTYAVSGNEIVQVDEVGKNGIPLSVSVLQEMVPSDMRAELGLLGAMMMNMAVYQSAFSTVVETGGKGGKQELTEAFAKNYADQLLSLVNKGDFNEFLSKIVTFQLQQGSQTEKVSPQLVQQWANIAKLSMLVSALALFYKAETGGMSGIEVASWAKGLMDGKIDSKDPKAPLVNVMHTLFKSLEPADRQKAIEMVMDFLDSKPSLDDMSKPMRVMVLITKNVRDEGVFSEEGGLPV